MCTETSELPHVTIVGAGPTGSLAAILLARRGYTIDVYERRQHVPTPNVVTTISDAADITSLAKVEDASKRSINLALSHRGLRALARAGLGEEVLSMAVPMRGRMIHDRLGRMTLQPYGTRDDELLYSISRTEINAWLLRRLSQYEQRVRVHYSHKCTAVHADGSADFVHEDGAKTHTRPGQLLGCDGAFSAVRTNMARISRLSVSVEYIEHGYKELSLPAAAGGGYAMPPEALHIWPGAEVMLIALPNSDGSFTCTLFGDFALLESLDTSEKVTEFFGRVWPDTISLMPNLAADYLANPNAALSTVRCSPWHLGGSLLLLGDAAHGVVPFYGQGMNCAMEDCLLLDDELDRARDVWPVALPAFFKSRKPATDCLAQLAIDNYVEMRDKTVSTLFLVKSRLHAALHTLAPSRWHPSLHTAVSFTSLPYHHALAACAWQDQILLCLCSGAGAVGVW
eukprot:CAMPEP_0119354984 /NCGR_PEP_ID=MMETSP1334-20130426/3921_1 /TAXON_ID=127549 /ORGANISM="Calcidiscus leptoporus, Strain RCC1130" /LENGTH=454 /DNA_ID=CAMNT_0007368701 /DNA_START=12 /DNA_END=1373 /DNA_ORIENTATION=+